MRTRDALPGFAVLLLLTGLAFDGGGYAPTAWGWSSVLALAALVAVALAPGLPRVHALGLAFLGLLAGLVAWTAASIAWSSHVSASVLETERAVLYLAVAALLVLLARPAAVVPLIAATLVGAALVCGYALGRRLLTEADPGVASADPQSELRLAVPLGYANAVGILAAMGALLALGVAARARAVGARAAAAAALPPLLCTLYFTYGRGAWAALALGLAAAIALGPDRLALVTLVFLLAVPSAAAVAAATQLDDARLLAALVPLAAVAAAAAAWFPRLAMRIRIGRRLRTAYAAALAVVPVAVVLVAVLGAGGPVRVARDAYDAFTRSQAPPVHEDAGVRILRFSGSSRPDYWRVAWKEVKAHPLAGSGAGAYGRAWLQRRPVPQPARDAHSLYLETLAELGPLGLALLVAALGVPLAAAVRARGEPAAGIALAPYAAYLAHAGQDWDWELPAVTVAALACAAALIALAPGRAPPLGRARLAVAAVAGALAVAAALGYAGNHQLAVAERDLDRGAWRDVEAPARRASRLAPWSAEPWHARGVAQLALGNAERARTRLRRALEIDDDDWEIWLDLALASEGADRREALARARRLNPLEPDLDVLERGS